MNVDQTTDRILYTEPFQKNLQGHLKARFRLDSDGEPMYELDDDDPRLRHYAIDLFLATQRANEIKAVLYYMDDPSYMDYPVCYSDDADNEFRTEIRGYGDVEIVVTVEIGANKYKQRAWLSNMLENGHVDDMTPSIRAAIQRIKVY